MQLQSAVSQAFVQLIDSVEQLTEEQFCEGIGVLHGNTIGQHVRHIIELFQCLELGYLSGEVDYASRKRDPLIETEPRLAITLLLNISSGLNKENRDLTLVSEFDQESQEQIRLQTNYFREIAYNLEHTIHHMALIRIGIDAISSISLSDDFGVASSTLKHRRQCAQ